jgi:hypothetical protein
LQTPNFLFFAQHGWSDNSNQIARLATALVTDKTLIIAPSLGLLNTYWRIQSLIEQVEALATEQIARYPEVPLKIMGHSMGGLIWLELLNRHPEWWSKVHSVVVIGSPIGGADIARIIDPLNIGLGIAGDLGRNRRAIAQKIAQNIPTLCIASDLGTGSDGMVTLETTKFAYSEFVCLEKIPHAHLRYHPDVVPIIQQFWSNPQIAKHKGDLVTEIIQYLQDVPGMTDADYRYLERSQLAFKLPQNLTIRTAKNFAGINYVFVTNSSQKCLYAGYVGWLHAFELNKALQKLQQNYSRSLNDEG